MSHSAISMADLVKGLLATPTRILAVSRSTSMGFSPTSKGAR